MIKSVYITVRNERGQVKTYGLADAPVEARQMVASAFSELAGVTTHGADPKPPVRKRGRPEGYRCSEATRRQMSESHRARHAKLKVVV